MQHTKKTPQVNHRFKCGSCQNITLRHTQEIIKKSEFVILDLKQLICNGLMVFRYTQLSNCAAVVQILQGVCNNPSQPITLTGRCVCVCQPDLQVDLFG